MDSRDTAKGPRCGPRRYRGKPLEALHSPLPIRKPHFGRRQKLMAAVLEELAVPPDLAAKWLELEETLRPLIMSASTVSCQP